MTGWMNITVIDNGFTVMGRFKGGDDDRCTVELYFEQLEDALDYIREQAGQVMDAEGGEYGDYSLDVDDDGLPIGWCD